MNSTARQVRPDLPVLLVIQPVTAIRHQIKIALSLGGHTAVTCVDGADDALQMLADGISGLAALLVPWPLADDGVQRLLDGLNILAPKPRPVVLVYGAGYTPHDLHDMAESGANALIGSPPRLDEVVRELVALRQSGNSPGRARLLAGAVPRPASHPKRATKDPNWRDRMVRLASSTRSRSAEFRKNRMTTLLARMDELGGGRISMAYVEALLLMARNDARQVESLIRSENLNRDLIDQCFRTVEERMQFPGGQPAPRAVIVNALEELVDLARQRRRGDNWSANYSDLKAGATDVVMGRLSLESPASQGYRDRLCAWLGVETAFLVGVDNDRLRRIAARVVKDPDEGHALDFARLSLLAHLLKLERIRLTGSMVIEPQNLNALSGLLGDEDEAARLLQAAAEFGEGDDVGADDLPPFAEFGSLFSKIEGAAVAAGIDAGKMHTLRASVATVAGVPVPQRGAALRAPGPARAATPPPAAPVPPPRADHGARLLPRLAQELGLNAGAFAHHDEAAILAQLDRRPLLDVLLPPAAVARLRVLALLLAAEDAARRPLLQTAILSCYENQPECIDALLQILGRADATEATMSLRRSLGLLPKRSSAGEILQILEADDPVLTWFAVRDLDDAAPETRDILAQGLDQIRSHEPGMPMLSALAAALTRRLARIGAVPP